mgnify:CR=1 FL=1
MLHGRAAAAAAGAVAAAARTAVAPRWLATGALPRLPLVPACARGVATTPSPPPPPPTTTSSAPSQSQPQSPPGPSGSDLVDELNDALGRHPVTTSLVYAYHNVVYAGILYGVLVAAGIPAPAELGVAFALNRVTTRLRLPIVLAAAAALVRLRPAYSKLQLTRLLTAAMTMGATTEPPAPGAPPVPGWVSKMQAVLAKAPALLTMGGMLDKFGLAYVLAGRVVATISILSIATALRYGVDIGPLLSWVGSDTAATAADWAARWTVACLAINVTYPVVLRYGVARVANRIGDAYAARRAKR